jgi:hypothetical protein
MTLAFGHDNRRRRLLRRDFLVHSAQAAFGESVRSS